MRTGLNTLNHFWKRWSKEYLLELRDAYRTQRASQTSTPAKPGDVVVVHDDDHPRGYWKLAVIEKLIVGRDRLACGAVLQLSSKDGQHTTLQRPLQRLYPLEISSEDPSSAMDHNPHCDTEEPDCSEPEPDQPDSTLGDQHKIPASRPQRRSATTARARFKEWSKDFLTDSDTT